MSFLSRKLYNCKYGIFVAKICKYGIFVAKICKYALIDRFQGSAGFLDNAASLATLQCSDSYLEKSILGLNFDRKKGQHR